MKLNFKLERVEYLVEQTKRLLIERADLREGFDEPGLILASRFGAGVYLMSGVEGYGGDWTVDLVFAERCNPNGPEYSEEIAVAAYGYEETAELIPLPAVERSIAVARETGDVVLSINRQPNMENDE